MPSRNSWKKSRSHLQSHLSRLHTVCCTVRMSLANHRCCADNKHRSEIKMLVLSDTSCYILLGDRPLSYQENNSRMTEAWVSCINRSDRSETCSLAKSVNYAVAEGAHNPIGRQTNWKELIRKNYLGYIMFVSRCCIVSSRIYERQEGWGSK